MIAQVTDQLIADIALIDGIITAIAYDTDAIETFRTGGGQRREIVVGSRLKGVLPGADGVIIPGGGLQPFQFNFMFGHKHGVLDGLVELSRGSAVMDDTSYQGVGPPADDDAVGGSYLEVGPSQEVGAGAERVLGQEGAAGEKQQAAGEKKGNKFVHDARN